MKTLPPQTLPPQADALAYRLDQIERAILSLAAGNFDETLDITGEHEQLDAIAAGISMLGEELRATTVTKEYLDSVLDAMLDILLVLAPDGTILQANRATCEVLGCTESELLGKPARTLFANGEAAITPSVLTGLAEGGSVSDVQASISTVDGDHIPVLLSLSVMNVERVGDRSTRIVLVARDITERSRTQQELQRANRDLERLVTELEHRTQELDLIGEMGEVLQSCHTVEEAFEVLESFLHRLFPEYAGAVCRISASGNVIEAHTTWNDFPEDMQQRIFAPDQCWALRRGRIHTVEQGNRAVRCRHVPATFQGSYLCIPMLAQSEALGVLHLRTRDTQARFSDAHMRLAHTVAEHVALALANITLRESLRSQSIRDPLTGLFNRRYMEETFERELHRAARADRPLGLVVMDVDHFKRFNDTFGHEAGDLVLRSVATVLAENTRGEDIACRLGGEEFALILPDATLEGAAQRADELRKRISALALHYREQGLATVNVSAGVAAFPTHGRELDQLMRAADTALYQAKADGRDRTVTAPIA